VTIHNEPVIWTDQPAELLQRTLSVVAYIGKALREADEDGWPKGAVEAAGQILTDIAAAAEPLTTADPDKPATMAPFYEGGEPWAALTLIWPLAEHMARGDIDNAFFPRDAEIRGAGLILDGAVKILRHHFDKDRKAAANGGRGHADQ
jgi:hypothetical protein